MKISICVWFVLFPIASGVYGAPFRVGDIFLNAHGLLHFRPDGTLVQTFPALGTLEGATVTHDKKLVTTIRNYLGTPAVQIFFQDGSSDVFTTPQVEVPADVSVFNDGTIAVNDQVGHRVQLYSPQGQYVGEITHSTLSHASSPFGSAVGPDDTLWLALFEQGISRFTKVGEFLGHFTLPYAVHDLAIDPVDGTLWIGSGKPRSEEPGFLHHLHPDGEELGSFPTLAVPPFLRGIAVARDQTIYITSQNSPAIYHYDQNGNLLDQIEISSGSINQLFMSVLTVPEPTTCALVLTSAFLLISRHAKL